MGFKTGSIAAGSAAAGLMSTYGGHVAAGSMCASLQSIGAVGLTTGLTVGLGVLGAGLLVGGLSRFFADDGFDEDDWCDDYDD